jgi:UDP-glucose 4-epimerase
MQVPFLEVFMSWLVSGGADHLGANVVRAFQDVGLDAVVIDDPSSGHREFLKAEVPLVEGSMVDPSWWSTRSNSTTWRAS